jgi:3-oxoadipate enol-lactonase
MQQSVHANGIDISYEIEGQGPWLILSHSLAAEKAMWQPQVDALAASYRVLSYDIRGHGASGAPAGPYTLDLLAQDVEALCAALGIEQSHFVGLSLGGMIGQTLALRSPQLLLSLTLADTSSGYGVAARPFWQGRSAIALEQGMAPLLVPTLDRWFTGPFRRAEPALMSKVADWIMGTPPHGYSACCQAIAELDTTARLASIMLPTLVMVGAEDEATPPAMAELIHREIAGSELVKLSSAAHIASLEQAVAFNRALLAFLGRCKR